MNVAKSKQAATRLCAIATYKGRTYTTLIIPSVIWVNSNIPRVEARGAASENHSRDISIKNIKVTRRADIL